MDVVLRAALAGLVAGLAVAVPMGAISVLILQEGLTRGWRAATAAATGVALVDLGYAALATAAGTAVTQALEGRTRAVQAAGAAVLLVVAVRGLASLRRDTGTPPGGSPAAPALPGAGAGDDVVPVAPILRRFVAMTLINPLTAVYFVVLAAGLGTTVAGPRAGAAFVAGVFAASWSWQLVLALVGSFAGARMPPWARAATGLAGYVVVIGYAVRLAAG